MSRRLPTARPVSLVKQIGFAMVIGSIDLEAIALEIERRGDGALLVRVPSSSGNGKRLPDAVFSFRHGDPQYSFWHQRFTEQQTARG